MKDEALKGNATSPGDLADSAGDPSDPVDNPAAAARADAEALPVIPATPSPFPPAQREAIAVSLGVTAATAIAIHYAFSPERAGTAKMLIALVLFYGILTIGACVRLYMRGELRARFRPSMGDLTLGAATAGALYGLARIVQIVLAPHGSARETWIMRLYLQLGDPAAQGRELMAAGAFVAAVVEEITWRGLVLRSLEAAYGLRRAVVLSSILFGAAHIPTLFVLADPVAGKNPLIVIAALGCGLIWGIIYARTSRLVPCIFAHAFFTWAVVDLPIWRPWSHGP